VAYDNPVTTIHEVDGAVRAFGTKGSCVHAVIADVVVQTRFPGNFKSLSQFEIYELLGSAA
jgi:hypothetical protein